MQNLKGKIALVTGASRGIGFATAAELARCGCGMIINSQHAASLDAARMRLDKIQGGGGRNTFGCGGHF